jgi:hypothetical protein
MDTNIGVTALHETPACKLILIALACGYLLACHGAHANEDASSCPLDEQNRLKPGHTWNIATAQLAIAHCEAQPITVVRRISSGDWSKACAPPSQDLSSASTWTGCAPPPACTDEEQHIKRQNGQVRLEAWRRRCSGKKTTIPIDTDPICSVPMLPIDTIVVHQTEARQVFGPDELQKEHRDRGFDDLGYHYVVAKTRTGWRIFEGRSEDIEGAHAGAGLNAGSIGIAVAGDYRAQSNPEKDPATLVPPPEAVMLLKSLVADLASRHHGITQIYGHGEHKMRGSGCDTDCPSVGVQQLVNAMRKKMF